MLRQTWDHVTFLAFAVCCSSKNCKTKLQLNLELADNDQKLVTANKKGLTFVTAHAVVGTVTCSCGCVRALKQTQYADGDKVASYT